MAEEWLGWHWIAEDRGMSHCKGRPVIEVGKVYTVRGALEICRNGLHACRSALDALAYAPGPVICRVRLSGEILEPEGSDKACARRREVLWIADATRTLRLFGCDCAERALMRELEAGRQTDRRSWSAIATARRFGDGRATPEELDSARAAAWDSAWDAARAASGAAWAAAWDAAGAAAWDAAGAAERQWQSERLDGLLLALGEGDAARAR